MEEQPFRAQETVRPCESEAGRERKAEVEGKDGSMAVQWGGCESNDFGPTLGGLLTHRRRVREDQEARDKEKGKRQEARASKKACEEDERAAAIAKFKSCRSGAGCTCGEQPCPQQLLHFCEAFNTGFGTRY